MTPHLIRPACSKVSDMLSPRFDASDRSTRRQALVVPQPSNPNPGPADDMPRSRRGHEGNSSDEDAVVEQVSKRKSGGTPEPVSKRKSGGTASFSHSGESGGSGGESYSVSRTAVEEIEAVIGKTTVEDLEVLPNKGLHFHIRDCTSK